MHGARGRAPLDSPSAAPRPRRGCSCSAAVNWWSGGTARVGAPLRRASRARRSERAFGFAL